MSPSSQRVWIEIEIKNTPVQSALSRPLHRGCGLKFSGNMVHPILIVSPSSQRVWIEIRTKSVNVYYNNVALFTEGVDWNTISILKNWKDMVALFTEGVDWNWAWLLNVLLVVSRPLHRGCGLKFFSILSLFDTQIVALFTEGVDWNR